MHHARLWTGRQSGARYRCNPVSSQTRASLLHRIRPRRLCALHGLPSMDGRLSGKRSASLFRYRVGRRCRQICRRNQDHREDPPRGKRCSDHGSEPRRASSHTTDDQYDRRSEAARYLRDRSRGRYHRTRSPCRYAEGNFPWRRRCRAGAVLAFELGVMDVPFAPAKINAGRMTPVRDNHGAIRVFDHGNPPPRRYPGISSTRKLPNAQPRKAGMRHSKWLWTTLERSLRAI